MDNPPRPTTSALDTAGTTTSVLVLPADNDVVLVAALETPRALCPWSTNDRRKPTTNPYFSAAITCLNFSVIHGNHDGQSRTA